MVKNSRSRHSAALLKFKWARGQNLLSCGRTRADCQKSALNVAEKSRTRPNMNESSVVFGRPTSS